MRFLLAAIAALLLGACATTGANDPRDPWEGFNRGTFEFNQFADRTVLKPVAKGYEAVFPEYVRARVNDFFGNLNDVGTSLNNVLQGKMVDGINDLGRVMVNTTMGIGGLWDVATPLGVEKHTEDFGQTLGWWGVPSGPYFVIPLFGPSTARDAPARLVDPNFYYNRWIDNSTLAWSLFGLDVIRTRANLFKAEGVLDEAAIDRYTFIRDAWLQRRQNQVYDGKPPREKEEE